MHPTLQQWHQFVDTQNSSILNEILADEVIFYSPVVFRPQKGKFITMMYLMAATQVFINSDNQQFTYLKEVIADTQWALEFETVVDGITINGIDIITINETGKIIEFKVMIRPLQAVNKLHEKMQEMMKEKS